MFWFPTNELFNTNFYGSFLNTYISIFPITALKDTNKLVFLLDYFLQNNQFQYLLTNTWFTINFYNIFINLVTLYIHTYIYINLMLVLFKLLILNFFNHGIFINLNKLKNEVENNLEQTEDFFILGSLITSFIILNALYFYKEIWFINNFIVVVYILVVYIVIPVKFFFFFGYNFIAYLKGTALKKYIIIEFFYDILNLISYFSRFFLQNVRILLIFLVYFSFHEYLYSIPKATILNYFYNNFYFNNFDFFYILLRFLFELLDTTFSMSAQFASFFFVIFWLFSCFNTYEQKNIFEQYFSKK